MDLLPALRRAPLLLAALAFPAAAQVVPSPLFTDHAVLQSGMSVPVWGTAAPAEKVTVTLLKQHCTATAAPDGRWLCRLPKLTPGGPFDMTIAGTNTLQVHDILVGEVWVGSGQSNMVFTVSKKAASFAGMLDEDKVIAAANYPRIRMFTVKDAKSATPLTTMSGEWLVASPETVGRFSAVGYLFARDLQAELKLPVGILTVAYGASTAEAWLPRPAIENDPLLKPALDRFDTLRNFYTTHPGATTDQAPQGPQTLNARPSKPGPLRDPVQDQHQPTVLFNAMLNPVLPYAMRGVLWYQGESIVGGRAGVELYPHTMDTLVSQWRTLWGEGDFPFFAVQLAALGNASNNPSVREAQTKILALPNTGLAITIDIGDPTNVHPKNKEPLGDRLARLALAKTYGRKIEYSGPQYDSYKVRRQPHPPNLLPPRRRPHRPACHRASLTPQAVRDRRRRPQLRPRRSHHRRCHRPRPQPPSPQARSRPLRLVQLPRRLQPLQSGPAYPPPPSAPTPGTP